MNQHNPVPLPWLRTRRAFIRDAAVASAGLAAMSGVRPLRAAEQASRKLVVGVMGMGRGASLANEFAGQTDARVKYVCDVDEALLPAAAKTVTERQGDAPQAVTDFRRILDDRDVDALVIAAPDHWHAPASILACAAGKHVYVEKPCTHNPREGELLVEAARKNKRIVQHGTQRRSYSKVVEAIQKLHAGEIGRVLFSRGWYTKSRPETGRRIKATPPANLDWALWQGPAPEQPFTENVVHYKWHWFWDWGTGELGNNGIHSLDICRWGLNVDYPTRVTAGGGRYWYDDDQETPDTLNVTFDYGDKCIVWEGRSCQPRGIEGSSFGIGFYGDKGTMLIDGNGYKVFDPDNKEIAAISGSAPDEPHVRNFLTCIRTGEKPVAEIEEGVKSVLMCHLGNIAYRVGRSVNLDPQTHRITGDAEAEKLWSRDYQPGWEPRV